MRLRLDVIYVIHRHSYASKKCDIDFVRKGRNGQKVKDSADSLRSANNLSFL